MENSTMKSRLVSCAPSTTEILLLLGLAERIVGVDAVSAALPGAGPWTVVGPWDNVDVGKIEALKPDLVIITDTVPGADAVIDHAEELGLPLLTLHSERFDDLLADVFTIGAETGEEEAARAIVAEMHERAKRLAAQASHVGEPLRVYVELFPNPFVTIGSQNWIADMLKKAGAVNLFADIPNPTFVTENQEIIDRDPEAVFICWAGQGDDPSGLDADSILTRKGWQGMSAVRRKQVHFLPESLFNFPGPRLFDGLELLIRLVARAGAER
ncbi:MAG: hypothetical protein C4523_03655 [Myxococcales bacterium]|nr:MAG: hypothetical protein C4523_03655 [Myxococcales bacterium]